MAKILAIIVGRFQPLHEGHKYLIRKAVKENNTIVIGIGPKRKGEPLTYPQRRKRIWKFLNKIDKKGKHICIGYVPDAKTDKTWLNSLKKKFKITEKTRNIFYTGDKIMANTFLNDLKTAEISVKTVKRLVFEYIAPDGRTYEVSSASEIRMLSNYAKSRVNDRKAGISGIG